jgi:hypothetical protein
VHALGILVYPLAAPTRQVGRRQWWIKIHVRQYSKEWFSFRVTEFPVERAFTIGWWCYITPVSSILCPNIELCQLFHWPQNVNKPNLVFLHILECICLPFIRFINIFIF